MLLRVFLLACRCYVFHGVAQTGSPRPTTLAEAPLGENDKLSKTTHLTIKKNHWITLNDLFWFLKLIILFSGFVSVASVPLDNWRQHSELLLFYHYITDNQGFIIRFFTFASWRVAHSPRMRIGKLGLKIIREVASARVVGENTPQRHAQIFTKMEHLQKRKGINLPVLGSNTVSVDGVLTRQLATATQVSDF